MPKSEMYNAAKESDTLPQYYKYMAAERLEIDEPNNRWIKSTDIQKKHKRYIRNVFMKNIDLIISEMVYPKFTTDSILASHEIQICIYKNGKVKVVHGLSNPDRSELVFRMTEDQQSGPDHYHEWSFLNYFELMLSEWYGEDGVSISTEDDRETYFKNGLVDIKREDISKVGFFRTVKRHLMPYIY